MILINDRLRARREQAGNRKLVCLQGPGGSGKTTAADWWARESGLPVVWLYLEEDPGYRHAPSLLAALTRAMAKAGDQRPPDGEVRLPDTLRLSESALPGGFCLVLDDYHLVSNPEVDQLVSELLQRLPTLAQMVITSRQEVNLPTLPRLQARRQALVISERDLAMEPPDIATLLGIPAADATQIHARTNGWIFALNLLQDLGVPGEPLSAVDIHDHLARYLYQDLLAGYDAATIRFMQITALMDSFSRRDCLVLELPQVDETIQRLCQGRLLSQRQEGEYAYHALIRQALAEGLAAEERRRWRERIGHHWFHQGNQACLPVFLAAEAWAAASKAVVWFQLTQWLEHAPEKPTMRYWLDQMPGQTLQSEPWFLLAYWLTYWRTISHRERLSLLDRIAGRFTERQDIEGMGFVAAFRGNVHDVAQDPDALRELLPTLAEVRQRLGDAHPVSQTCVDLLIRYYLYLYPDRSRWETALAELQAMPLVTPSARQRYYTQHLNACERYVALGEFEQAKRQVELAAAYVERVQSTRSFAPAMQAIVDCHYPGVDAIPEALTEQVFADESGDDELFVIVATYARGLQAWSHGRWAEAEAAMHAVVAYHDRSHSEYWSDLWTSARLRLGALRQRQRDLAGAKSAYQAALKNDRSVYEGGNIRWHLAWAAQAGGRSEQALGLLAQAESEARRRDHKFLLAKTLLLRAIVRQEPPPAEACELVERWEYRHALALNFPEGLSLLESREADDHRLSARVQIRTLGRLQLLVDGVACNWKRSNCQMILLDLLLHPQGSSGVAIEQRYWPRGNAGLRTDVQALRKILEPDKPGRDSRYVHLADGKYRWTIDRSLYWWDVQEFEALCKKAQTASNPDEAAAARREALKLYQGPFAPEIPDHRPIIAARERLHRLYLNLQR